jgi:rod shape-determining protein MreC
MKWISDLFSGHWRAINLFSILALCLVLILGGSQVTSLVSGAIVTSFYYPFFKVESSVSELVSVRETNERLLKQLVETTMQVERLEEAERENTRLRAILGFEPPAGYTLLQARVISVTGEKLPIAAEINRGARDSVMVDQALINEFGLIGRVVSVFENVSTVQLLTDPANRVAVRVANADSREMGIVKYRTFEGMFLDNLPIQSSIRVGDTVISSGLGGLYPPGLRVGVVESVERPEEEPFCTVHLAPAANFSSLEELFLLRPLPR